ncbi:hypothetical protein D8674_013237 [Pyrus ussuriensis x Pyrus communis]|uniref:Uncharacterized protein n=1 Tax=Pyrus ussuriensis x Pyrus communis TaxID=2448454 RepID=A0A5N5GQ12_9ROSA|nr:hypothetical protein D8674_013237 [Pyrus ussuriensis x Pyrus communis]
MACVLKDTCVLHDSCLIEEFPMCQLSTNFLVGMYQGSEDNSLPFRCRATECVQALSGVLPEPITFPKEVVKDNDVYPPEVAPPLEAKFSLPGLTSGGVKVHSGLAEHTSLLELIENKLLCWRDMMSYVATLGVFVGSLVEKWESCKEKGILDQFIKVNKLEHALELQHKELEAEKLKLKKLVYGCSKEITACLQLLLLTFLGEIGDSVTWQFASLALIYLIALKKALFA